MVLGIRYLTGYCVSRDLTRQEAEWPPHPARVFMAMAATHFETGADKAEREALLWLESQPPPEIFASPALHRSIVETYVPVNDQHGAILKRPRQSRSFPTVRPDNDHVYLSWPNQPDQPIQDAISRLCAKVTRIGHSSSLTQMWVSDPGESPTPNWHYSETDASHRLRIPGKGLLHYLDQSFNGAAIRQHSELTVELAVAKGKRKAELKKQIQYLFGDTDPQSMRPIINTWGGYRELHFSPPLKETAQTTGPFDPDIIVLNKFEGRTLGLESTLQLTLALRNALLKACPEPYPEWLSGHSPDGSPSRHPHIAFFPIPFVGATHADGHVMGLAMAIPKELVGETRPRDKALRECVGPLFFDQKSGKPRKLCLWKNSKTDSGRAWEWEMERELREKPPLSLMSSTWTAESDCWASVTPVVLHHYPNKGKTEDVERILRDAFKSAQLPEPAAMEISVASAHVGAGSLRDIPTFTDENGLSKYSVHAVVTFSRKIAGPMLVGRGRFRGYGLFRPFRRKPTTA